MAGADVSLKSLESQLGKQLQHLPFDRLETKHLADEPDALSFKILLGYIKAESDNDKLETWVHFYTAKTYNGNSETQFHNYYSNGQYFGKSDGETISRDLCGCASAFALPKLSRGKLIALAKYYFLRKVVESDSKSDREMLKHGVKISRTFREDLKSVCKEFEEDRPSPFASPATKPDQESSQETGEGFSEGTTATAKGDLEVGHATVSQDDTTSTRSQQMLTRLGPDSRGRGRAGTTGHRWRGVFHHREPHRGRSNNERPPRKTTGD
jgi:hypothetical protein